VNAQVLINELGNPVHSGKILVLKNPADDELRAERGFSVEKPNRQGNFRNRNRQEQDDSDNSENPKRNKRTSAHQQSKKVRYQGLPSETNYDEEKENRKIIFKNPKNTTIEDEGSLPWHKNLGREDENLDGEQDNPYITEVSLGDENSSSNMDSEHENKSEESYYSHYSQEEDRKPVQERKLPSPRLYKPPRNSSFARVRAISPERESSPAIVIKDVLPEEKLKKMRKREKRRKMLATK